MALLDEWEAFANGLLKLQVVQFFNPYNALSVDETSHCDASSEVQNQ